MQDFILKLAWPQVILFVSIVAGIFLTINNLIDKDYWNRWSTANSLDSHVKILDNRVRKIEKIIDSEGKSRRPSYHSVEYKTDVSI